MTMGNDHEGSDIPSLLGGCKDRVNVLLYLLLHRAKPLALDELWVQQKGATKWSKAKVAHLLQGLEDRDLVKRNGAWWTIGSSFDAEVDPSAAMVAQRLIHGLDKPRIVEKVDARRDRVVHELAMSNEPISAAILFDRMVPGYTADLRTLQRDLVELEKQSRVVRDDAGWMVTADIKDELFVERARAAALRLLADFFECTMPMEIQLALKEPLRLAKNKLESLPPADPRNRWIESFRPMSGYYPLDEAQINGTTKEVVEEAILRKMKVHITASDSRAFGKLQEFSETGSISHYMLEFPSRPQIVFWPDQSATPRRVRLEDIEAIEMTPEPAKWPAGYDPEPFPPEVRMDWGDYADLGGQSLFVLRVSDGAMKRLRNRRIGHEWSTQSSDEAGWSIVSFRAIGTMPLFRYLRSQDGVVILRPTLLWKFAQLDHRKALNDYNNAIDLVLKYKAEEDLESGQASEDITHEATNARQ